MRKVLPKVNHLIIWRKTQRFNKIIKINKKMVVLSSEPTGIVINLAANLLRHLPMKIGCLNKKNKIFSTKNKMMKSYFLKI